MHFTVDNTVTAWEFRSFLSLIPDDSPLLLRNNGTQDIYSLDWETAK
jgi:hypothetical protein